MFDSQKKWTVGVDIADQRGNLKHSEILSVDSISELIDLYPGELLLDVRAVKNAPNPKSWAEKWNEKCCC